MSTPPDEGQRDPTQDEKARRAAGFQVRRAEGALLPRDKERAVDTVSRARTVLELLALVAAPTSLLIALAFYFGWKLTEARAAYFGIDYSTLGYSTQDYVLRSADALFIPLSVTLVAGLIGVATHAFVADSFANARRLRLLRGAAPTAAVVGAVLFGIGAFGAFRSLPFRTWYLLAPLSLPLGIALLAYSGYIHDRLAASSKPPATRGPRLAPGPQGIVLVILLIVLSVFWAASEYAAALGRGRAQHLESTLSLRPGVIVYSRQQLGVNVPGVIEEALTGADSAFHYRYTGLRLLIRSDDKYFLLPDGWTRVSGIAIVLPDSEDLRFEFTAGQ